jgi:hypothetical protein
MHKRTEIRHYIISAITNTATLGANVFGSRVYPLEQAALPSACVYTVGEESERRTIGGSSFYRDLAIRIDVYVSGSDIDDLFDQVAEEIEAVMEADRTFGGHVIESTLNSTEISFSDDGDRPNGLMSLNYECLYITQGA